MTRLPYLADWVSYFSPTLDPSALPCMPHKAKNTGLPQGLCRCSFLSLRSPSPRYPLNSFSLSLCSSVTSNMAHCPLPQPSPHFLSNSSRLCFLSLDHCAFYLFVYCLLPYPTRSKLYEGKHFCLFCHYSLKECLPYHRGSINIYCMNKLRLLEEPQTGHGVFTWLPVCNGRPSVNN